MNTETVSGRGIFADNAPTYWGAGLQAIPLLPRDKGTRERGWTQWCKEPIPEDKKAEWLLTQPEGNIGVAAGPASGVTFIDIDTPNEALVNALLGVLPPSPWKRVGKKGLVLAYRCVGDDRSFQIKSQSGEMIVEFLSVGRQVVVPPSIHPETGRAYFSETNLWDPAVLRGLMVLPPGLEGILRSTLEDAGAQLSLSGHTRVTDWVSRGSRDVQMIAVAGLFTNGVLRGELSFKDAVDRLVAWHSSCVDRVAGDDVDITKGVRRMAEFLVRDVCGPKQRALPVGWDAGLDDAERTAFGFDIFNANHEKWSGERIKEFLKAGFMTHEPDSEGRIEVVNQALTRMAMSDLDPMMEEQLVKYAINAGQMGVPPGMLKRKIAALKSGGIEGTDHNQIADAVLAELTDAGPIAWTGGALWKWGGSHWVSMDEAEVLRKIAEGYSHMPAARRQTDHQGVLKVLKTKVRRELKIKDRAGVNFANGFLTTDLELIEHHPDDGCTYTLPYRWREDMADLAMSPKFKQFLEDSWLEDEDFEEKMRALREALAITLFGMGPQYERAFCLHGPPASGKSQMLRIVGALVPGEAICAVSPDQWGDKFLPAQMHGKLLNLCGELPEKRLIEGQKFKEIISGETITGQHKHQPPFKFKPICAHWFATNHIPRTNDVSAAFNRRWLILTFEKPVPFEKRVRDLGTLIVGEEREGIAAWAAVTMRELVRKAVVTLPKSHEERIGEIARANNSLRWFLLDSGRVLRVLGSDGKTGARITEQMLYDAYYAFAFNLGGAKPVSLAGFRQAMRELGSELGFSVQVQTERSGAQICEYRGLTLASSARGKSAA